MRSGLEPRQNDVRPCKFKSLSALTFLRQIDPFNISNNKLTQNIIGKGVSRFVPLIGAVGVGAYAYFDTTQVAKTAIELFSKDIILDLKED